MESRKATLEELLAWSKQHVDKMSPEEKAEMVRQQGKGYARAEASWPKPSFKIINGAKVYDSYEDYCND